MEFREKRVVCFHGSAAAAAAAASSFDQSDTPLRMFLPPAAAQAAHNASRWHDHTPQLLNMFPHHREHDDFTSPAAAAFPFATTSAAGSSLEFHTAFDDHSPHAFTTTPAAAAATLTYHHQAEQQPHQLHHEHLFYKVVTPSDVGKLNRLVIPKQHAERCFPLDPSLRKKGRFLAFQETQTGKMWWFRYSYWNSSQSYVFTKGWIRFVKENKLKAGDIVSFERGASPESFYISCRKRPRAACTDPASSSALPACHDHLDQHDVLLVHMVSSSGEQLHEEENEEVEEEIEDDDNITGSTSSTSQTRQDGGIRFHSTRLFGVEIAESSYQ